ncbi:mCG145968, partial [Mus musculus]
QPSGPDGKGHGLMETARKRIHSAQEIEELETVIIEEKNSEVPPSMPSSVPRDQELEPKMTHLCSPIRNLPELTPSCDLREFPLKG